MEAVIVGIVFFVLLCMFNVVLNQRDDARKNLAEEEACGGQLLGDAMKEIDRLRSELEADSRVRSLQEQVSALIDENATLRAQVEMSDDIPIDSTSLGDRFREDLNALADKHDSIGVVEGA